jgi:hypothetical protein
MPYKDVEKKRSCARKWAKTNYQIIKEDPFFKEENQQRAREWRLHNREQACIKSKEWAGKHEEEMKIYARERARRIRLEVLQHYGGNPPICACCGENIIQFLALDHHGAIKQKGRLRAGTGLFEFLRRNNFPEGYRVLCHNCNQAIGSYGVCPHQTPKQIS